MRDLIFVSAGFELTGGGRAAAARLFAASCAAYAEERRIGFSLLSLGSNGVPAGGVPVRSFGGRQGAMALAVWRRQLARPPAAYVYDLLGLARIAAWLPGPLRAPYLVPLYGIEGWQPLRGDRFRALRNATVRLAISTYTAERTREVNPGLGEIAVLPLCLEERQAAGIVDLEILARAGEGYVLIVGRMAASERYKGHDQLLAAIAGRPDLRLVVVGDGDDRPRLERAAAALGLSPERAFFTGFVSEATRAELYRRAALFAMPSRGEGFGLVYLEAMRAGKPCLAARGGAAAEVVADGETGLLVDPDDPAELAAALSRLLDDPEVARRLGEAGRRRCETVFTPECFRAGLRPYLDQLTGADTSDPHVRH
ncbi:MAG TPA: glycosyltransferase family 4 protein [Thermoanaerobaculia bacterium]|nr:glycosyltransferase family 4 protein [Thermoanaerobaculia bacterium]